MSSLRAELTGGGPHVDLPEFRMLIPAGWKAYDTSVETEAELLKQASRRLMPAHRVDLQGLLAAQVSSALRQARAQGALAMVMPGPETAPALFAPASLLVLTREAPSAATMDSYVVDVIRRREGKPLDTDERFVRWVTRGTPEVNGERMGTYLVEYLTPVPGSERRKALHMAYSLAHPLDVDPEQDKRMSAWITLMDVHVATFVWAKA